MDWREVPLTEHMVEAARVVDEAEVVIEFSEEARGWFRITVFEDLRAEGSDRYFARARDQSDPDVSAIVTAATPEEAAAGCLREAGVSLRRARGR